MDQRRKKTKAPDRNGPEPQLVPINDLENETNDIPEHSDPNFAHIRLSYDWTEEADIDADYWQPHVLAFPRDRPYTDIVDDITSYLHSKIEALEPTLCSRLDQPGAQRCVVFQLALHSHDCVKQYASTFTPSGAPHIKTLQDLCEDNVKPELEFTLRRTKEESRQITKTTQKVAIRPSNNFESSSQYFLIGSVKTSWGNEKLPQGVRYIHIVDYFFWKQSPGSAGPTTVLVQVPAWRIGVSVICDLDSEAVLGTDANIPRRFKFNGAYSNSLDLDELDTFHEVLGVFLNWRRENSIMPYDFASGSGLTYDFQNVDDLLIDTPSLPENAADSITMAVHFVQHIQRSAGTHVKFERTKLYRIAASRTHEQLKTYLSKQMGLEGEHARLCDPSEFGLEWDMDLWIMHQGGKTLLRFKPGIEIRQFLQQEMVDGGDVRLFLEAHIIPIDPAPTNLTIDEAPDDPDGGSSVSSLDEGPVRVSLTYDFEGEKGLEELHETSEDVYLDRSFRCEYLFDELTARVRSSLTLHAKGWYDRLERNGKKEYMLLRPVLNHSCPVKRRALSYGEGGAPLIPTLDDFLDDTTDANNPRLEARLELVDVLARNYDTLPLVVIRPGVEKANSGGTSQYYHIGTVQRTPTQAQSDQLIPTSDTYFWRLENSKPNTVAAPTWAIRNFDICEPGSGLKISDGIVRSIVDERITATPLHSSDFLQAVREGRLLPCTGGRLQYSFKTFGVAKRCPRPVNDFPSDGISVAIRFVSHLGSAEASKLVFSSTFELALDKKDNEENIQGEIEKQIRSVQADGKMKHLYKPPLEDQWNMQFWILPQVPGGRTLYRYQDGVQRLHHFLNETEVNQGDTNLFMEAHLVLKR